MEVYKPPSTSHSTSILLLQLYFPRFSPSKIIYDIIIRQVSGDHMIHAFYWFPQRQVCITLDFKSFLMGWCLEKLSLSRSHCDRNVSQHVGCSKNLCDSPCQFPLFIWRRWNIVHFHCKFSAINVWETSLSASTLKNAVSVFQNAS